MAVQCTNTCASESYFFDWAVVLADFNSLAHLEGAVCEDGYRAEEVGDGVFCCQGDSYTADAGTEQDRFNILLKDIVHNENRSQDGNGDAQGLANYWYKHIVELCLGLACPANEVVLDDINESIYGVGNRKGGNGMSQAHPAGLYSNSDTFDTLSVGIIKNQTQIGQMQSNGKDSNGHRFGQAVQHYAQSIITSSFLEAVGVGVNKELNYTTAGESNKQYDEYQGKPPDRITGDELIIDCPVPKRGLGKYCCNRIFEHIKLS